MLSSIAGLLYFIVALGMIVLVHELGHLIVAKYNNVYCHEFSIGMGPKIYNFYNDKSGTKYNIRAIPLGGYVMMAGEQNLDEDNAVDPELLLGKKSKRARFLIMVAGAVMNFVFAILILAVLAMTTKVYVPLENTVSPTMINVVADYPAANAGITDADIITAVNGVKVTEYADLVSAIQESPSTVEIEYIDDLTANVDQVTVEKSSENTIGISSALTINPLTGESSELKQLGFLGGIIYGFTAFFDIVVSIGAGLMSLFTGSASVSQLSGPVGIYTTSSQILAFSPTFAIYWVAYLSINIGFVNLLPIPALDGGRILLLFIEAIIRKPLNKKVEEYLIVGSMLLLFGLLIMTTFFDFARLFGS